ENPLEFALPVGFNIWRFRGRNMKFHLVITCVLACTLPGCARLDAPTLEQYRAGRFAEDKPSSAAYGQPGQPPPSAVIQKTPPKSEILTLSDNPGPRVIVYTANFCCVVKDVDVAVTTMQKVAEELGGYLVELRETSVTIRVPSPRFRDATDRVERLGQVSRRDIRADDVTDEYVDLDARLKNAKAMRERLQALRSKADDIKAALEVEKEIARVSEEIERLQGKIELLKNRIAFSTITVSFERVVHVDPPSQITTLPFAWLTELNPNRLTSRALRQRGER
ncbi:MAG TPA: DUF4349 domain-containing protein, partial [Phycisphaerae bacterium]|nr:DUF4349 domain-containing protein [Phycisphaerae bacterium]